MDLWKKTDSIIYYYNRINNKNISLLYGKYKNELKYNNKLIKEEEIIKMVETSLSESYEEIVEEDDEISILSSLRAQEGVVNIDIEEELEIVKQFNLELIIIIDHVDMSRFEKYNETGDDKDDDDDYDMEELIKEFV